MMVIRVAAKTHARQLKEAAKPRLYKATTPLEGFKRILNTCKLLRRHPVIAKRDAIGVIVIFSFKILSALALKYLQHFRIEIFFGCFVGAQRPPREINPKAVFFAKILNLTRKVSRARFNRFHIHGLCIDTLQIPSRNQGTIFAKDSALIDKAVPVEQM